jgi:hypothetical protein
MDSRAKEWNVYLSNIYDRRLSRMRESLMEKLRCRN